MVRLVTPKRTQVKRARPRDKAAHPQADKVGMKFPKLGRAEARAKPAPETSPM